METLQDEGGLEDELTDTTDVDEDEDNDGKDDVDENEGDKDEPEVDEPEVEEPEMEGDSIQGINITLENSADEDFVNKEDPVANGKGRKRKIAISTSSKETDKLTNTENYQLMVPFIQDSAGRKRLREKVEQMQEEIYKEAQQILQKGEGQGPSTSKLPSLKYPDNRYFNKLPPRKQKSIRHNVDMINRHLEGCKKDSCAHHAHQAKEAHEQKWMN